MDLAMVKNQIDRVINYWFTALHPKWTCRPNEIMLSYGNGEDLRSCVSVGSNGNFLIWTIVGRVRVTSAVQKNIDMFNATEKTSHKTTQKITVFGPQTFAPNKVDCFYMRCIVHCVYCGNNFLARGAV